MGLACTLTSGAVVCVDQTGAVWSPAGEPDEYYGALNHHAGPSYNLPAGWSVYAITLRTDGGYTIVVTAPAYIADPSASHNPFRGYGFPKNNSGDGPTAY